jgi:hypothetical protein
MRPEDFDFGDQPEHNKAVIADQARTIARLTAENEALRELTEYGLRQVDGHIADLQQLKENLTQLANGAALIRLSAEAGDQGTWMGGGLEITYPSAEVGDTDG